MLLCRFRRWLSPFAPRSSVCRPRRLSSIFPSPPVADMGKSVARGGSSEAKPKEKPSPVSSHKDEAYLDAVIQKRVHLFETIQVQQKAERLNLDGESIKYVFCPLSLRVTLPDGTIKEGKKWLTSPMDIAKEISSGLAAKEDKEEKGELGVQCCSPDPDPLSAGDFFTRAIHRPRSIARVIRLPWVISSPRVGRRNEATPLRWSMGASCALGHVLHEGRCLHDCLVYFSVFAALLGC
ncbi:hypothetical protein BHE74_00036814 [Ensete ventricosum]|nr:hypothetical protein BHE74_00036814 [Ensete ventricosum]